MTHTRYPVAVGGVSAMIHMPHWQSKDATGLRMCVVCFGHGGSSLNIAQSSGAGGGAFGNHPQHLADQGYVVGAVDYSGTSFLNPAAMTLVTALRDYMLSLGALGPKAALFGWSMGGGTALRWYVENPASVAVMWLCSPLTDLDWAHTQGAYQAEIDAAYGGDYAGSGSPRSPITNAAALRGGPPCRIVHPTDDPTVPYAQSQAFIAAVGDPNVDMRQPDLTGGHQGGLLFVDPAESTAFIRDRWAA